MLFALSIAGLLVHLLVRERAVEEEPRRIPGMRLLAWVVVALIAGSLLAGFVRFAAFAAGRVVFTLSLVATLYLLLIVTDAAINRTMSAELLRAVESLRASSGSIRAGSACSANSPPASCGRCSC